MPIKKGYARGLFKHSISVDAASSSSQEVLSEMGLRYAWADASKGDSSPIQVNYLVGRELMQIIFHPKAYKKK
jgi:hypothetical protein